MAVIELTEKQARVQVAVDALAKAWNELQLAAIAFTGVAAFGPLSLVRALAEMKLGECSVAFAAAQAAHHAATQTTTPPEAL